MAEKKYSALALLDILIEESDEDHILTAKELQQKLLQRFNLQLERRTIYSNLDILEQNGYVISRFEDNGKGYYLESRQFDKGEILLLCNAIHSSHFISSKQSDALIKKLLKTQSKYQAKEFKDSVYIPNPQKTANVELLYTISTVSEAIRDKNMIQFLYLRYDEHKHLVPRREEPYFVEPRYIVYADGRPYLISTSKNHPGFIHYRLDRMKNTLIEEEKVTPLPKTMDAYEYARNKLFMFSGDMISVTFKCDERVLDHILDLFGSNTIIIPGKDNAFSVTVPTSEQGAIYLAQQYLDAIEITAPTSLRKQFQKELEESLKKYKR
ncbi:MAG: WYL domain-containing transcriptional regulator [Solobacterium sp.]|nr:WYL domain-containing transcriptional regulator [Solobacterium sp.]